MAEMEKMLEKEKLNIKKQFEKERNRIQQGADIAEEEKHKLCEELKQREEI